MIMQARTRGGGLRSKLNLARSVFTNGRFCEPALTWSIMPIVVAMLLGIACSGPAFAQEPVTIEATSARTFSQLPEQWKAVLDSHGSQLVTSVNGLSVTVVEIWWSKAVPGMEKAPVLPQVNYSRLKPGAVVGLLYFPAESPEYFREDSRDQKLKPGFYTLRYAQLSADPSDDQPSPYRDFVLLSPLDADQKPDQALPSERLIQLSRRASRSQSPAAISLVPPNPAYKHLPFVIDDDSGQCILQANIHVAADGKHVQEIPLAIVLITPTKMEVGDS